MCCPETADLHLGKEVDQQPSATKQTHPPLNLEATVQTLWLVGYQQSWLTGSTGKEDLHTHTHKQCVLEYTTFTYTFRSCCALAPKTRQEQAQGWEVGPHSSS